MEYIPNATVFVSKKGLESIQKHYHASSSIFNDEIDEAEVNQEALKYYAIELKLLIRD